MTHISSPYLKAFIIFATSFETFSRSFEKGWYWNCCSKSSRRAAKSGICRWRIPAYRLRGRLSQDEVPWQTTSEENGRSSKSDGRFSHAMAKLAILDSRTNHFQASRSKCSQEIDSKMVRAVSLKNSALSAVSSGSLHIESAKEDMLKVLQRTRAQVSVRLPNHYVNWNQMATDAQPLHSYTQELRLSANGIQQVWSVNAMKPFDYPERNCPVANRKANADIVR